MHPRPSILFCALAAMLFAVAALAQTPDRQEKGPLILRADIDSAIGPATAHYVEKAIETAGTRHAEALVLRMNTPGGLSTSMREIISTILSSPVPVVGYVAPPGAHAASAGTYILYATHVAAMAPGTNIGAATPVQIGGGGGLPGMPSKDDKTNEPEKDKGATGGDAMQHKVTNDAVALIRSLAELRGRNVEWAEKAVREAATLSAVQADDMDVIDFIADDQAALLKKLDGRKVLVGGAERTLSTRAARVEVIEPGFVSKVLGVLSDPNIAFILMLIGVYGLIFELANPGSIGPGLAGVICLVLALYSLNQLPLDYAGLALVLLGLVLMVAEAFTPTMGVVGVAGLASFVIGGTMLIDTDVPAFQLSWTVIAVTAAVSAALLMLLLGYVWRSHRRPPTIGPQHIVGSTAEVIDWKDGSGHVLYQGERWNARGHGQFDKGASVRVQALDGLTLEVVPADAGHG